MKSIRDNWHKIILILILLLAGFLSFYAVWNEGYANTYYSAAVKSMLSSWHNFFFASFDPGGFVTVDKPALGLWLQCLSALVFGFHGWSLILPESLSTVISVGVLYHLVKRSFGKVAGLISALALAWTPILIAVSRTNNLDASLVMIVVLAAWALIVASEKESFKLLLLSMVLIGFGFNVKMLEAFMVLPAFYLVYLFTSPLKPGKKILHLTGAAAVVLLVALSWSLIVDMTPAGQRPYVGSSQTNSEIELAIGYNGIQRVTGRTNGIGIPGVNMPGGTSQFDMRAPQNTSYSQNGNTQGGSGQPNAQAPQNAPDNVSSPNLQPPQDGNNQRNRTDRSFDGNIPDGFNRGSAGGFGGPGGSSEGGQIGVFRIFNEQMAGQISWLIPLALFGILAGIFKSRKMDADDKKKINRSILLWGAWLAPMYAYFSIAGYFHRYYLSMMAPGIAALTGIGITLMWKAYLDGGWKSYLLPAALIADVTLEWLIMSRYNDWNGVIEPIVCIIGIVSAVTLILIKILSTGVDGFMSRISIKRSAAAAVIIGSLALLAAPAAWSYTPIIYGSNTSLPVAGPELERGGGFGRSGNFTQGENSVDQQLIDFLLRNNNGEKYILAVQNASTAAPIIIQTGRPVMAFGGFLGSDPILTVERLQQMVKDGEVRYFLASSVRGGESDVMNWVSEHGTVVNLSASSSSNNSGNPFGNRVGNITTLIDLAPEKGTK